MNPVIHTNELTKKFDHFYAVKNVSLQVNKGEIYGFIGLNGAGKTTVIKMLLNMIRPTKGVAYINGNQVNLQNNHIWHDVGYIVERPVAYPELTVEENLQIHQKLRLKRNEQTIKTILSDLNLTAYTKTKAKNLSLGNFGRLGLAKALLHDPNILILDEPMNGLDPAGIVEVRHLLQDLAQNKGVTILMSSHLLTEVAKVATKIGMIHHGQLVKEIKSEKLNEQLKKRLIINTTNNKKAFEKLAKNNYNPIVNDNGEIEVTCSRITKHPEKISKQLVYAGFPLTKFVVKEENLESYFLRVIEKEGESFK